VAPSVLRASLAIRLAFVAVALAGCQKQSITSVCGNAGECQFGYVCVNDEYCARLYPDAGPVDAAEPPPDLRPPPGFTDAGICQASQRCGQLCCPTSMMCVEGRCAPPCANERCGADKGVCCSAGQVCLDGVACATRCQAQQTICGATLGTCCATGEVCLNDACVKPGAACMDDFDCLEDDTYCDTTVQKCLPLPKATMCMLPVTFEKIDIITEWHWAGATFNGKFYENVLTTPAIGDVSGDGIPDVIVAPYAGNNPNDNVLVALKGRPANPAGEVLWIVGGADAPVDEMVALANLDGDPALEIVYQLRSGGIRIINGDGMAPSEIARRAEPTGPRIAPAIADMNQDGTPDIVAGCKVYNGKSPGDPASDLFDRGTCESHTQRFSAVAVADLDGDGMPDVTNGDVAYGLDMAGTVKTLFDRPAAPRGIPAIADLNSDDKPEIVVIRDGQIEVIDGASGAVRVGVGGTWAAGAFPIPDPMGGGSLGGAPTVADFDNDGLPEVSAAGRGYYAVYDPDCLATPPRMNGKCVRGPNSADFILWATVTQDLSSSATGSSVFDFQGDGVNEVIYNDECFLHVYDGRTGSELLTGGPWPNSTRTRHEYPVVADVDLDGNSEIIVTANRDEHLRDRCPEKWRARYGVATDAELPERVRGGTSGVWVFGDPKDQWVRTRPIWNQYSYHVTNVGRDGVVPRKEENNWSVDGLNNYRTNVQGARALNAPNLVVKLTSVRRCASNEIILSAVITNAGARGVPEGILVEFLQTAPGAERLLEMAMTKRPLLPGGSERLTVTAKNVMFDVDLTYLVRVDGMTSAKPVAECKEDDNNATVTEKCQTIF
jgi:hypothetical protein